MRTVHDTENHGKPVIDGTPRTSPPTQQSNVIPSKPPQKLKLVLSTSKTSSPAITKLPKDEENNDNSAPISPLSPRTRDELFGPLPSELAFTEDEAHMSRKDLFQLLRHQIHWAEKEASGLQKQVRELEKQRKSEWLAKELVFENTLEAEFEKLKRKGVISELRSHGLEPDPTEATILRLNAAVVEEQLKTRRIEGKRVVEAMANEVSHLPMQGQKMPWYRDAQWKRDQELQAQSPGDEDDEEKGSDADESDEEEEPEANGLQDDGEPAGDDTEVEEMDEGA